MNAYPMPDYSTFSVDDFTFDPAFRSWVTAPTPRQDAFWQEWLAAHPERRADVRLARQIVLSLSELQPDVSQSQIEHDVAQMLGRIGGQSEPQPARVYRFRPVMAWASAAAVVLLLGLGWWFGLRSPQPTAHRSLQTGQTAEGDSFFTNKTNRALQIILPDGSEVMLSPRSTLRYTPAFDDTTRDVTLEGEAFFTVVKNPKRPFRVYSDAIVTRVLGTSFRVSAYPDKRDLTVTVRTGKVSVYTRHDLTSGNNKRIDRRVISLTPNQQAQFSRETTSFQKKLADQPVVIDREMTADNFEFDETPVEQVLQRVEKAYGIDIIYDSDVLQNCALTASLADESLNNKLTIICKGIEARYEVIDGKIIIQSRGCR